MDSGWWALALTVIGAFIGWVFRSPKEVSTELNQRIASLEVKVSTMAEGYASVHARHDETMRSLTAAMDRLTNRVDVVHEALLFLRGDGNGPTRRP